MDESERKLLIDLAVIGCEKINPDNPLRVAASVAYLVDLYKFVDKYLVEYKEVMDGFISDPENYKGWGIKIANLQNELEMYHYLAKSKLGVG